MDSVATTQLRDEQVPAMGSQHAGGEAPKKREVINESIGREEELLEKLEKMFLKIKSKSTTNRDAWEGEDEDTEEVLETRQPAQKQKQQSKAQLLATHNRDQAAGALGDRETAEHYKRNTFSFKHGPGPRKNDNNRKQKTEEELNQLRKFALQRHCKKKRRTRKTVANEKAEAKIDQMMAVHAELKKTDVQKMESTLRMEGLEQKTMKNEEMSAIHAEKKAKHLSENEDFDKFKRVFNSGLRKTVADYYEKARAKRDLMMVVHAELKKTVIQMKSTPRTEEQMKAKQEQMSAMHAEMKRLVFLKGLCLEEDDDDQFVPRKLFIFKIDNLQKVSQIEVSSQVDTTSNGDVPSFSEESVMADVKQKEAPPKENNRLSPGQRFVRFFGFR